MIVKKSMRSHENGHESFGSESVKRNGTLDVAIRGVEIIAHPSNLVMPVYAQVTMRARALENGVFTITANRVGIEARTDEVLRYTGESQIVSPSGEILVRSPAEGEDVQVVEIDPAQARDKSLNAYNDRLADRRPDLYLC